MKSFVNERKGYVLLAGKPTPATMAWCSSRLSTSRNPVAVEDLGFSVLKPSDKYPDSIFTHIVSISSLEEADE